MLRLTKPRLNNRSKIQQQIKDFLFKTVAQQDRIIPWIGKRGDVTDPATQARRNIVRTVGIGIMSYYTYYAAKMHEIVKHFSPITHDWSLLKSDPELRKRAEETFKIGNAACDIDSLLNSR